MTSFLVLAAWFALPVVVALVTQAVERRSDAQNRPLEGRTDRL